MRCSGARRCYWTERQYRQCLIEADYWPLNTVLYVKDFHGNDPRFVFHLLKKVDLQRFAGGAGVPTLNRNVVHDEVLSVPPIAEQKRLAGILDEAFDGIATAKANAEKNLQNARALFESHLQSVFSARNGAVETALGEVCQFIGGSQPPKSVFSNTQTADNIRLIQIRDYKRTNTLYTYHALKLEDFAKRMT